MLLFHIIRKFLLRLQDKGARVESLAKKLRLLIKEREEVDRAAKLFEKMDLGQEDSCISSVTERTSIDQSKARITVTEKKNTDSDASSNPGDFSWIGKEEKREKFRPNKDLKSTVIPKGLPRPSIEPSPVRGQSSHDRSSMEQREVEESSAVVPPLRNQEVQVVEFQESADLLQEQKKHSEVSMESLCVIKQDIKMYLILIFDRNNICALKKKAKICRV